MHKFNHTLTRFVKALLLFFFALALYLYILSGNEMAQKFVVSYYGAIFWFMYDYSNNL